MMCVNYGWIPCAACTLNESVLGENTYTGYSSYGSEKLAALQCWTYGKAGVLAKLTCSSKVLDSQGEL